MFKGTHKHKAGYFDKTLEAKGAIVNAATWKDYTFYYVTLPKGENNENFDGILASAITGFFNFTMSKTGLTMKRALELSAEVNLEPVSVTVVKKVKNGNPNNIIFERNKIKLELKKISETKKEYEKILEEVSNYKEKRDAINQEILRSRALEEEQDFYQIQLDDQSLRDIQLLQQIKPQLSKFEILNKLIYDNYVNKPTKEMVKRVLAGRNPTGIYKITNIQTKEIYIGKSVAIGERWQNHVKSACGLSGVAESQFQRALKKYGIQNFTWELLEETSRDKLTEREKYYIDFFSGCGGLSLGLDRKSVV